MRGVNYHQWFCSCSFALFVIVLSFESSIIFCQSNDAIILQDQNNIHSNEPLSIKREGRGEYDGDSNSPPQINDGNKNLRPTEKKDVFSQQIVEVIQNDIASSSLSTSKNRDLQVGGIGPYEILGPTISWRVFRLFLEYQVSDDIPLQDIKVDLYSDGRCSRKITSTDFLRAEVDTFDDAPLGNGSRTRPVQVNLWIDPDGMAKSSIVSSTGNQSIVSFCLRLSVYANGFGSEPANYLYTQLDVVAVFFNNVGIIGTLEDQELNWGIDAYQCNETGHEIEYPELLSQGQKLRLCIGVNNQTFFDGIRMLSVDQVDYSRGDILQQAVTTGQRIGDDGLSEIDCERGWKTCTVTSTLRNAFFETPGVVEAYGYANLQFGVRDSSSRNRNLRVGFQIMQQRQLYTAGEFVTDEYFRLNINVHPSTEVFTAEAYRCNRFDDPLGVEIPVTLENPVRICFRPDEQARKAGVYMRSIDHFQFTRDNIVQPAINDDGSSDHDTLVICSIGSEVCSLKTALNHEYFIRDGKVYGGGEATLQFGTDRNEVPSRRRLQRAKIIGERSLEGNTNGDVATDGNMTLAVDKDPGFAGISRVTVGFDVELAKSARNNPAYWWIAAPPYLKLLYAIGLGLGCTILCCFFGGLFFCFRNYQEKKAAERRPPERDPDESLDAFVDSKASFYTDLDFDTDASDDSSDEGTITDHFDDDDLEQKVAILFPRNPDPEDLSKPFSGPNRLSVSDHGPSRYSGRGPGPGRGQRRSTLTASEHGPPRNLGSKANSAGRGPDRLSKSEHGPSGNNPPSGRDPRRSIRGGGPGRGRGGRSGRMGDSSGRDLSTSEHPPRRQSKLNTPGKNISMSEHAPRRQSKMGGVGGKNSTSEHNPRRQSKMSDAGRGARGISMSEHGPRRSESMDPSPGGRRASASVPRGRSTGKTGPRHHEGGMTQVPRLAPVSMRGPAFSPKKDGEPKKAFKRQSSNAASTGGSAPQIPRRPPSMDNQAMADYLNNPTDGNNNNVKKKKKMKGKKPKPLDVSGHNGVIVNNLSANNDKKQNKKNSSVGTDSSGDGASNLQSTQHSNAMSSIESSLDDMWDTDKEDEDENVPDDDDVCFEAKSHPGTVAFYKALRITIKRLGPVAYSPKVYRSIKKKLPGRRFFICDDDDHPYNWREVTKSELIDLVWKYFDEEKSKKDGDNDADDNNGNNNNNSGGDDKDKDKDDEKKSASAS